jgi:hypothetical protein
MTLRIHPLHPRRIAENQAWWKGKSQEYPFHAEAPTSTKPNVVDEALGSLAGKSGIVSVSLRTGWRIYGFKTREQRDLFITQFNAIKVGDA